jgi:hypothetical protein
MNQIKYYECQTWRQEPDVYSGKTCDKQRPRWMTSYPKHGDEEHGEILELKIDAWKCPPGTRITIEMPICPKCGDPAEIVQPNRRQRKWPNCRCGFSWSKWVEEEFS